MRGMNAIAIRAARPDDAPALGRMGTTLARLHNRLDSRRFFASDGMAEGYASWLAKEMASRKAVVLAALSRTARSEERIVGYAYGRLEGRDWNTLRDPAGVGVDLYVEPRARRRGAGRLLLCALARELVSRGAPRVVIQVAARNSRALELFEGLGFRRTVIELALEADGVDGLTERPATEAGRARGRSPPDPRSTRPRRPSSGRRGARAGARRRR